MSQCKATRTHDCPDAILQYSSSWSRIAVYDDLLCGEINQLREGLATAVIYESSIEMSRHVNIPVLMKYMLTRHLLAHGEQWALTEKELAPNEKVLQLQQILSKKGEQGLTEFYLCLLESYLAEGGVSGHYILANVIKRKIRFKCGINPELFKQDASSIVPRIKPLPLSLECAESLLHSLGITASEIIPNNPTTQHICQCWLSANPSGDWIDLVEAFLSEPGLGWCVSETLPISSSNPPAICDYVRSLNTDWDCFAHHLGYPQHLIDKIQNGHEYDTQDQIQAFLRSCRIPDCGEEKTKTIIHKISQLVQLPKVKPKPLLDKKQIGHLREWDDQQDKELLGEDISPSVLAEAILLVKRRDTSARGHSLQGGASPTGPSFTSLSDRTSFPMWDDAGLEMMAVHTTGKQQSQTLHHGNIVEEKQQSQTLHQRNTTENDENDGENLLQNCVSGWWEMSIALIESGGKLDARTKNGMTPLHICCMKGNMDVIKLLLENNAEIAVIDNDGNTPLHLKQTLKNLPLVELLVDICVKQTISVDLLNKSGQSPLVLACQEGHICYKAACVFLTHGASPNGPSGAQSRPLIYACETGDTQLVDLLLAKGADIDGQDKEMSTPLIQACLCNHTGIAMKLLERGADPQKADVNGTTALAAAVSKNSYELVQLLIMKGANVNSSRYISNEITQGQVEETPLASACGHGFQHIAKLLIENGAKIDYLCSGQVPPIGFAIICRKQHMVKFITQLNDYKSIYKILLPMQIAMNDNLQNYEAAGILLDALGGPERALQEARDKQLHQLEEDIQVLMAVNEGRLSSVSDNESSQSSESQAIRDHRTKMEEVLQRFSQIAMSAATANRDCESIVSIITAFDAPHVAMLFRDYYERPPRPDILKAKFLGREHGLSPFNFLIQFELLDAVNFQVHALQFYPEGPDEFYFELVSAFHQIPGGENLPWEAQSVLQQLFSGSFQFNIDTAAADQEWERPPLQMTRTASTCTVPREQDESSAKTFTSGAGESQHLPNYTMKPGVKRGTRSAELGPKNDMDPSESCPQQPSQDESTGDSPKAYLPAGRGPTKQYMQQQVPSEGILQDGAEQTLTAEHQRNVDSATPLASQFNPPSEHRNVQKHYLQRQETLTDSNPVGTTRDVTVADFDRNVSRESGYESQKQSFDDPTGSDPTGGNVSERPHQDMRELTDCSSNHSPVYQDLVLQMSNLGQHVQQLSHQICQFSTTMQQFKELQQEQFKELHQTQQEQKHTQEDIQQKLQQLQNAVLQPERSRIPIAKQYLEPSRNIEVHPPARKLWDRKLQSEFRLKLKNCQKATPNQQDQPKNKPQKQPQSEQDRALFQDVVKQHGKFLDLAGQYF